MITLIAPNNIQGHYAELVLRKGTWDKVHVVYPRLFSFKDVADYLHEQTDCLIILGMGYKKSEHKALIDSLDRANMYQIPMTEVYHFASFGDKIEAEGVYSYVDEEKSPLKLLYENFGKVDQPIKRLIPGKTIIEELVEFIDQYHTYTYEQLGNTEPLKLKLLSDLYEEATAETILKIENNNRLGKLEHVSTILSFHGSDIELREKHMKKYIADKLRTVTVFNAGNYVVIMLYAEQYTNEIASEFIRTYQGAGFQNVIVLIGKHTKGDDMFSIRVSEGLHAGEIAKKLNGGKGKERSAVVFLTRPIDYLSKSVQKQLLT